MPSSTMNSSINTNDRKRRGLSSSNTKRIRRSELLGNSKNERQRRSSSNSNSSTKLNEMKQEYSLATEINSNTRTFTLRPLTDSFDNNNSEVKRDINSSNRENGSNENTINKKATAISLIAKSSSSSSIINQQDELKLNIDMRNKITNLINSDEEFERTKQIFPVVVPSDLSKKSLRTDNNVIIQQTDGKSNMNANLPTKLLKLVVPQSTNSSSSIKMLSYGDGLSSALRIPTKIQLTKTLLGSSTISINQQSSSTKDLTEKRSSIVDYPLTPPPPIIDNRNSDSHLLNKTDEHDRVKENSTNNIKGIEELDSPAINEHQSIPKRHLSSLSDWSVPPTSELSPTSLTSSSPDLSQNNLITDDSLVELDLKINRKRRYRSLSLSCPILPYCLEKTKPITPPYKSKSLSRLSNSSNVKLMLINNKKLPLIHKYSLIQRIKKRRRSYQYYGKRFKLKTKSEHENIFIIKEILNETIERIVSTNGNSGNVLKTLLNKPISQFKSIITEIDTKQCPSSDLTIPCESHPTIIAPKESDQSNSIPHIDMHETESKRTDEATKVEERTKELIYQKKANYQKAILRRSKSSIRDILLSSSSSTIENAASDQFDNPSSTPLSFHSVRSSSIDEQSLLSPPNQSIVSKTNIFTDIVNELIKGAKGLDKLSCSLINFTNSVHNFLRLTVEKQNETVEKLEQELEKKCSSQLNRAKIFCTQKIQYFINKHSIHSINEYIDEITLLIKYFYFYILSLNCRKQENEFELALNDLIHGKLIFINQSFYSSILTTIIEDFILTSSLANDYLSSQPILINQIEYSLPFIRNIELENELLCNNDTCLTINPFGDLEDYLNRCEHMTTAIPYYPAQQSHHPSMYYPPYAHSSVPAQYYYHPTQSSEMTPYYYHHPTTPNYSNPQQPYPYSHPSSYYNPLTSYGTTYNNTEQCNYYYNQPTPYTYAQANSTNDIPLSNNNSIHRAYQQMNSNIQRKYSNTTHEHQRPITPAVFDTKNVDSSQSKSTALSMNPINNISSS